MFRHNKLFKYFDLNSETFTITRGNNLCSLKNPLLPKYISNIHKHFGGALATTKLSNIGDIYYYKKQKEIVLSRTIIFFGVGLNLFLFHREPNMPMVHLMEKLD